MVDDTSADIHTYYVTNGECKYTTVGFIHVAYNKKDNVATIMNLESMIRGKGYATHLIVHVCKEAIRKGIITVELDDCSSHYRKSRNIYTKLGLLYIEDEYGPEMKGNAEKMCELGSKYLKDRVLPTPLDYVCLL